MKEFITAFDGLPWIIKLILALPGIDGLAWGLYRLIKGINKKDNLMIIAGIVWIFAGIFILWIIDMVTLIMYKKVTVLA